MTESAVIYQSIGRKPCDRSGIEAALYSLVSCLWACARSSDRACRLQALLYDPPNLSHTPSAVAPGADESFGIAVNLARRGTARAAACQAGSAKRDARRLCSGRKCIVRSTLAIVQVLTDHGPACA